MAGMPRGDSDIAQQATDPITPTIHNDDDTYSPYNKARQSASSMREKIAEAFQPGDNKATTRRLSDVPSGANVQQQNEEGQQEGGNTSVLQSVQETVSKALGGGREESYD
ncbi:hypothetical protein DTO021C3_3500 [Paecilomyces variotii]|nr:hypothetical protein DTO021C3_3500 [Paecilomyces variotii]